MPTDTPSLQNLLASPPDHPGVHVGLEGVRVRFTPPMGVMVFTLILMLLVPLCLFAGLIFLFSVGFVMGMLGVVGLIMMFMPALDGLYGLLKTLQSEQVVLAEGEVIFIKERLLFVSPVRYSVPVSDIRASQFLQRAPATNTEFSTSSLIFLQLAGATRHVALRGDDAVLKWLAAVISAASRGPSPAVERGSAEDIPAALRAIQKGSTQSLV